MPIEEFALGACSQQSLMRMLAVKFNKLFSELFELREGSGLSIDPSP